MHMANAFFLGDHLALDFLNTRFPAAGTAVDLLSTPQKLATWLTAARAKHPAAFAQVAAPTDLPRSVVQAALGLRQWLQDRLAAPGRQDNYRLLNRVLAGGSHYRQVVAAEGRPVLQEALIAAAPETALLPVANAIADLLCRADPERLHKCDNDACVLWFYDRTKAKRRRWCSMAICGNQAKVNSFRNRQAQEERRRVRGKRRSS
jgi:predicted RNA-binding Zn ribbon-like protein